MKPKILLKAKNPNSDIQIECLLSLGIWDSLDIETRREWIENGIVINSSSGKLLFQILKDLGGVIS